MEADSIFCVNRFLRQRKVAGKDSKNASRGRCLCKELFSPTEVVLFIGVPPDHSSRDSRVLLIRACKRLKFFVPCIKIAHMQKAKHGKDSNGL